MGMRGLGDRERAAMIRSAQYSVLVEIITTEYAIQERLQRINTFVTTASERLKLPRLTTTYK